jgi:hypothetical protein
MEGGGTDTVELERQNVRTSEPAGKQLLADTKSLNNGLIALGIVSLQVIEQATPLANQHEQAASGAMVLHVCLEMLSQFTNALAQQRNLDFRTAGVGLVRTVRVDNGLFLLSG